MPIDTSSPRSRRAMLAAAVGAIAATAAGAVITAKLSDRGERGHPHPRVIDERSDHADHLVE